MRAKEFISEYKLSVSKDADGVAIKATAGGKNLGHAEFFFDEEGRLDPQTLWVDERFYGQGIARDMYDHLKDLGYTIVRSWDQTDAGRGFWNKHRGKEATVWEGEYTDEYTFDIPKRPMNAQELIKRGAIFVVDPHGDNGWEPDAEGFSLVTLHNYYFGDPWCKEVKQHLKPEAYPGAIHGLKDPEELKKMSDQKYKQILWSIKKLGIPEEVAFLDTVAENFADGKVKGKSRPGRVKRAGASCNGSVTDLRRKARKYGGEKGKMYHWCANMKAGKKK